MTYPQSRGRLGLRSDRAIALAGVGLIHLALAYGLMTGLAQRGLIAIPRMLQAVNVPLALPSSPPAPPPATPRARRQEKPMFRPVGRDSTFAPIGGPLPMPGEVVLPETRDVPLPQPTPFSPPQPARGEASAARPRGDRGNWATPEDYPAADLHEGHEGAARFALSISPDGRVSDCTILDSSGYSGLDAATCRLVSRRARFTPARDADGRAVIGTYTGTIRWLIPR